MCWTGPVGAMGRVATTGFVIVPSEAQFCKVAGPYETRERAMLEMEENPRWRPCVIITTEQYTDAWNERFWNRCDL